MTDFRSPIRRSPVFLGAVDLNCTSNDLLPSIPSCWSRILGNVNSVLEFDGSTLGAVKLLLLCLHIPSETCAGVPSKIADRGGFHWTKVPLYNIRTLDHRVGGNPGIFIA
jgi:hypothetical protein